jgi:hypothetical protein
MVNVFTQLFKDDGSTLIFTSGLSASGTTGGWSGSVEAGGYVDPKNNVVHIISKVALLNPITAPFGAFIMTKNINEAGFYVGGSVGAGQAFGIKKYSGSVGITEGIYTSREDAEGSYFNLGASGGIKDWGLPISIGGDAVFSIDGKPIGVTSSLGLGAGTRLETHERFGVTVFVPLYTANDE